MLVPVKAFGAAKRRLAPVLTADARRQLARSLADGVITAAAPLPVFVACDDDEVATWADAHGAEVLWGPGLGLNGAIDHGTATVAGKGFDHVIVAHGDLAVPDGLARIAVEGTVVLVPDRHRDGTNVLSRPCALALPALYGGSSFRRHFDAARDLGARVCVRRDPMLALDVDTIADCRHPAAALAIRRAAIELPGGRA